MRLARQVDPMHGRLKTGLLALLVMSGLALVFLTFFGARALLLPAPPFLPRAGRVLALLVMEGIYSGALGIVLWAVLRRPEGRGPFLHAACAALVLAGTALAGFASSSAFFLLHGVCYGARACAITTIPQEGVYALNVATQDAPSASLIVLVAVAAGARVFRRRSGV